MASKTTNKSSKLPDPSDVGQVTEELFGRHYPIAKIDVLGDSCTLYAGLVNGYNEIQWEEVDHIEGATMDRRSNGGMVYTGYSPDLAQEMRLSREDAVSEWVWTPVG